MKSLESLFVRIIVVFGIIVLCKNMTFSQSGNLDISFGNGGTVVTSINNSNCTANSVVIRNNGKIVVGGSSMLGGSETFTIVQYNSNGNIDTSFGNRGKIVTSIGNKSIIYSIILQSNGKLIAGGYSEVSNPSIIRYFTLCRYNQDGTLDTLFGNNGVVQTLMNETLVQINKLLIRPNGKIIAAGKASLMTFDEIPAVVQYNANGTLDSSFGNSGKIENSTGYIENIADIILMPDGKLIATGQSKTGMPSPDGKDFALFRYSNYGKIDSSFGTNGIVYTDFNNSYDVPYSILALPDSSVVVAGYSNSWSPSIT